MKTWCHALTTILTDYNSEKTYFTGKVYLILLLLTERSWLVSFSLYSIFAKNDTEEVEIRTSHTRF